MPTVHRFNVPPNLVAEAKKTGFPDIRRIGLVLASYNDEETASNMAGGISGKYKRFLFVRSLAEIYKGDKLERVRLRANDGSSDAAFESWHQLTRTFYGQCWNRLHVPSVNEELILNRKLVAKAGVVTYRYFIPKELVNEFGPRLDDGKDEARSISLRMLTGEDELALLEAYGNNPVGYMRHSALEALTEVDGVAIGDAVELFKNWTPKGRAFLDAVSALSQRQAMVKDSFFAEGNQETAELPD